MSALRLNERDFDKAIAKGTALVDFYAEWCAPCRSVLPIVDAIAGERQDLTVAKVNVESEAALASKYNVRGIPTLIVFENGKEKKRIVGVKPKAAILAALS